MTVNLVTETIPSHQRHKAQRVSIAVSKITSSNTAQRTAPKCMQHQNTNKLEALHLYDIRTKYVFQSGDLKEYVD